MEANKATPVTSSNWAGGMAARAASKGGSVRARQPAHGELDPPVRKLPPGLDLGQVGRLGKTAKLSARLLAGGRARHREGAAAEARRSRGEIAPAAGAVLGGLAGEVGGSAKSVHGVLRCECRGNPVPMRVAAAGR